MKKLSSKHTLSKASLVLCTVLVSSCSTVEEPEYEEFSLDYESCMEMQKDKNHRYWNNKTAIQGCEFIIQDVLYGNGDQLPPEMEGVELVKDDTRSE